MTNEQPRRHDDEMRQIVQSRRANHSDVGIEVFMLLAVRPIGQRFRRALEVNGAAVATDAGIEGFVTKTQRKAKLVAVIGRRQPETVVQCP